MMCSGNPSVQGIYRPQEWLARFGKHTWNVWCALPRLMTKRAASTGIPVEGAMVVAVAIVVAVILAATVALCRGSSGSHGSHGGEPCVAVAEPCVSCMVLKAEALHHDDIMGIGARTLDKLFCISDEDMFEVCPCPAFKLLILREELW